MQSWGVRLTWFDCKLNIKQSSDPSHPALSLPADVRWGEMNECVTNEPQRTSAGRLPCSAPVNKTVTVLVSLFLAATDARRVL